MIQHFDIQELELQGAYLITPFAATDERGALIKDYNVDMYQKFGLEYELKEVFYTISKKGVIRAIHFQEIKQQPKLVRCISGRIYDVIVDLRTESPTFGKWKGFELTGDNMKTLLIPKNFGHGYLVLEDSIVSYKCAETFFAEGDSGIVWNDKDINIDWPLDRIGGGDKLIISEKDLRLETFREYKARVI